MTDLELINLRLIDPVFGSRDKRTGNVNKGRKKENTDLGLIHENNGGLENFLIKGGWKVLKEALSRRCGYLVKIPSIHFQNEETIGKIITANSYKASRYPIARFRETVDNFINNQIFGKENPDLKTASEYIQENKDALILFEEDERESEGYKMQEEVSNRLYEVLQATPAILGMPLRGSKTSREVAIYTRTSKCIITGQDFEDFQSGNPRRNPLTICDFITEYSNGQIYITELKSTVSKNKWNTNKIKAKSQLARSAIFFQQNFRAYPTLVLATVTNAKKQPKIYSTHYKFYQGKLRKIPKTNPPIS